MVVLLRPFRWSVILGILIVVFLSLVILEPGYVGLVIGKFGGNLLYGFGEAIVSPLAGVLNPNTSSARRITIDVLNEHETVKLITREVQTRLTFTETERYGWLSTIVGERQGTLRADITFVYGIDIEAIKPEHVSVTARSVIVNLPPLEPLYVIPELDSLEYESESSYINQLIDQVHDLSLKQEIYRSLQSDALTMAHKKRLQPETAEIFRDLEAILGPIVEEKTGRSLTFR